MKILQTSNIYLGRSYAGTSLPGDKLRAGIKTVFSAIIDKALENSVDLVVFAGDTFANPDISQNLLDFFVSEVNRLENIPAVIIPGSADPFTKESFWAQWQISCPAKNLHILTGLDNSFVEFAEKSLRVYAFNISQSDDPGSWPDASGEMNHNIAAIYGNITSAADKGSSSDGIGYEKLKSAPFDYMALGGHTGYARLIEAGVNAAYSGSPTALMPDWNDAGNVLIVDINDGAIEAAPIQLSGFQWKDLDIPMEAVINTDDLKTRLLEHAGENVLMSVTLSGLTLLEAGLDLRHLRSELEEHFLNIDISDNTSVLPDNVSGIKVREKTILGQYLKVAVDKLNTADPDSRKDLEDSIKAGYTLLTGRELW